MELWICVSFPLHAFKSKIIRDYEAIFCLLNVNLILTRNEIKIDDIMNSTPQTRAPPQSQDGPDKRPAPHNASTQATASAYSASSSSSSSSISITNKIKIDI